MGLFNPQSREEQAHWLYHENTRFREINKEKSGILRFPIPGLSDWTWTSGLYHPNGFLHQGFWPFSFIFSENRAVFTLFDAFLMIFVSSEKCTLVHNCTHYALKLCTDLLCNRQIRGLRYFYVNSETVICQVHFRVLIFNFQSNHSDRWIYFQWNWIQWSSWVQKKNSAASWSSPE